MLLYFLIIHKSWPPFTTFTTLEINYNFFIIWTIKGTHYHILVPMAA